MERSANCPKKLERWRRELDLPHDTDIYKYYDLDWAVTIPNMDTHIKKFEIVKKDDEEVVVRTGFEALIGSVCEGHETLWRIVGSENVLLWIALCPDELGRYPLELGEHDLEDVR